jgi:hypothetical protein
MKQRMDKGIKEFQAQYELTSQEMLAIYWYKQLCIISDDLTSGLLKIPAYIGTASRFLILRDYPDVVQMLDNAIATDKVLGVKDLVMMEEGNGMNSIAAKSSSPYHLNSKNPYRHGGEPRY